MSSVQRPLTHEEGAAVFAYYFDDTLNGLPLANPENAEDVLSVTRTVLLQTGQPESAIADRKEAIAAYMAEMRPLFESLLK